MINSKSRSEAFSVRADANPGIPLDPLRIQTMADYDLTLCLYRTWFEYDVSRCVKPGVVSAWEFDSTLGAYRFTVSLTARWSDGTPVTSEQLIQNLIRASKLNSGYGLAVSSLVNVDRAQVIDEKVFTLPTRDRRPSELFFQRIGSSFLAIVNPLDLGPDLNMKSNIRTNGPYKIESVDARSIKLRRNSYDLISPSCRPDEVEIRRGSVTGLVSFLSGNSWANVIQTATLMPKSLSDQILEKQLPYWTRGIDRVSKLKPLGRGDLLDSRRVFVKAFAEAWAQFEIGELPFKSSKALSLQPEGYPLFERLDYSLGSRKDLVLGGVVKIIVGKSPQYEVQMPIVETVANRIGVSIEWVMVDSAAEAVEVAKANPDIGFDIFNFGVADPEPTTWMGMVLNPESVFVDVSPEDLVEFRRISHLNSQEEEIRGYKSLLKDMALRGSYVPLFHFSTLSLGKPGISFENIHELDETVDYSRLVFKAPK